MEHRAFPSKKRGLRGVFSIKINYNPKLKELARKLRNKSTKSEIKRCNEKHGWGFTSNSMLYCRL